MSVYKFLYRDLSWWLRRWSLTAKKICTFILCPTLTGLIWLRLLQHSIQKQPCSLWPQRYGRFNNYAGIFQIAVILWQWRVLTTLFWSFNPSLVVYIKFSSVFVPSIPLSMELKKRTKQNKNKTKTKTKAKTNKQQKIQSKLFLLGYIWFDLVWFACMAWLLSALFLLHQNRRL